VEDAIVTRAVPDDDCCPGDANANLDNDCDPRCGNSEVELGETCDPVSSCPNQDDCVVPSACLRPMLAGDRNACTARCDFAPITACTAGDGCCPTGCAGKDSDCPSACGDGYIDRASGETCEADSQTPCPDNCDDRDACTSDRMTGSAGSCNVTCAHVAITQPIAADGCCPDGANQITDADCSATCGNGVREVGEVCDDSNLSDGDGCSRSCQFDDDQSTTGDDRTGYLLCGDPAGSLTCTSQQHCCYWFDGMDAPSPYTCSALSQGCSFSECDGAEDCGAGEVCCFEAAGNVAGYTNDCREAASCGGNHATIVCHRDASGACL
jgi:cysteine-rich repeat protein